MQATEDTNTDIPSPSLTFGVAFALATQTLSLYMNRPLKEIQQIFLHQSFHLMHVFSPEEMEEWMQKNLPMENNSDAT